jgi:hypothetical protein
MLSVLQSFGEFGPLILTIANLILMRKKQTFQFYYFIFIFVSILLNFVLKLLIKQPRPSIDDKTFMMVLKKNERFVTKNGMPYDVFGMPSGHSQSVVFSTLYNYLVFHNMKMSILFLLISLNTMIQRVVDKHHTILQVIVGASIGALLGYFAFHFAEKNII